MATDSPCSDGPLQVDPEGVVSGGQEKSEKGDRYVIEGQKIGKKRN